MVAHADNVGIGIDDVVGKTKFIKLPQWLDFAKEAAWWMLGECLSHPIHAGEIETTEETNETTDTVPSEATFNAVIASTGKKVIYYKTADLSELLTLSIKTDFDNNTFSAELIREGLGATTRVKYASTDDTNCTLGWSTDNYYVVPTNCLYGGSDGTNGTCNPYIHMIAQTINVLPTSEVSATKMLPHSHQNVIGTKVYQVSYAENTFFTNNSACISNHLLISQNTFNTCCINSPVYSGTTINAGNIGDFRQYGYDIDVNNNLTFDPDILAAYIEGVLAPQLELVYKNTYTDFPEPGATYGDDDITYINPFGDEEEDPTEGTAGQIQPFSIDYDEILGEREMESMLAETRYVLDTAPYEIASIDYNQAVSEPYAILKQNGQLPAEIAGTVSNLYSIALSIVPEDMLSVYGFVAFISVGMWFILRR